MDNSVLKSRMQEALELKTGEAFEVVYHGGSQPGKKRLLLPLKVSDKSVFAHCYNSNATKTFLFKNAEFLSVLEADNILNWLPEDFRTAKEVITDFAAEILDELRPQVWSKGYLIGGEERTRVNDGKPVPTGIYEIKVVGHRARKGSRPTYLTFSNEKDSHSSRSWKLKIKSGTAERINDFNIAVNSFIHELERLPDVSNQRSMIEHYQPHKDPIKHFYGLWNQNADTSKAQRTSELIVGTILKTSSTSFKFIHDWAFDAKYAFRDGLGLKYETRTSSALKPYLLTSERDTLRKGHSFTMWTQGPILYFKQGDSFNSRLDDSLSIQVQYSDTMGWDPSQSKVHEGLVNFNVYRRSDSGSTHLESKRVCTQYEFLNILVNGNYRSAKILEEQTEAKAN